MTRPIPVPERAVFQPLGSISSTGPARLLQGLWHRRALLGRFLTRDLRLKYRGSFLGFFWSLLGPLLLMAVYSVVFSVLVRVATEVPYPLFVLAGLVPWLCTARALERACHVLLEQGSFLQKVYFPRVLLVASAVGVQMAELVLSLGAFLLLAAAFGHFPGPGLLLLPLVLAAHLALIFGLCLALSVGTVFFRDLLPLVGLGLQVWFYLSPVIYPSTLVLGLRWDWLYGLNPMAGLVEGYRAALLGTQWPQPLWVGAALGLSGLALAAGAAVFRRWESAAVKEL